MQLLVISYWLLLIGYWLLVISYWLLVIVIGYFDNLQFPMTNDQ
ncbi:D-galactonate transporter [Microcoleus sp. herbarium14]